MRCFISAGHSETDPGADPPGPETEHAICAAIAREMAHQMKVVEPHLVPSSDLKTKIAYVNRWSRPGDIAVEIHLNSGPPQVDGCEVYYYSTTARGLASELHASLVKIGRAPRGVKPDTKSARKSLGWCRLTKPWAALVEVAFITNPAELAWLQSDGVEQAALALAKAADAWA